MEPRASAPGSKKLAYPLGVNAFSKETIAQLTDEERELIPFRKTMRMCQLQTEEEQLHFWTVQHRFTRSTFIFDDYHIRFQKKLTKYYEEERQGVVHSFEEMAHINFGTGNKLILQNLTE